MKRDAVVFAVSGAFFGLLVGWILGSQQRPPQLSGSLPAAQAPAAPASGAAAAVPLDENKVKALEAQADRDPKDAAVRVELGNAYFDAERYQDAIRWYETALKIDPRNVNVSTDLGVAYYYSNQPDRALQQFDYSLSIDPRHAKTMLNMGIVRAFGKQDLAGAIKAWEQVIAIAPDSPEGRAARQALDSLKSAHPGVGGAGTPGGA
jgi:cytochrome c-type biogenesis protein CcmH/NrfG